MTSPLYWSSAFTDALVAALRTDPAFLSASRKLDDTIVLRCLDTPEGVDVEATYRIVRGTVELTRREEKAPSRAIRDAPFDASKLFARTTAPYAVWTKLDRGAMNVLQAIASPEYAVEGPKMRIMMNIALFNAMGAVAAKLPKRYA